MRKQIAGWLWKYEIYIRSSSQTIENLHLKILYISGCAWVQQICKFTWAYTEIRKIIFIGSHKIRASAADIRCKNKFIPLIYGCSGIYSLITYTLEEEDEDTIIGIYSFFFINKIVNLIFFLNILVLKVVITNFP